MDEVVRTANYHNPSREDQNAHAHIDSFGFLSVDEANAVFDALAEKIRTSPWPQRSSDGERMMSSLCSRLKNLVSKMNTAAVIEEVAPHILKVLEAGIAIGLPASIIDISKACVAILPREYFEDVTKDRFTQVLELTKAGSFKSSPDDEQGDYARRNCHNALSRLLRAFDKETYAKFVDVVPPFSHFLILAMLQGDDDAAEFLAEIHGDLKSQCDEHPLFFLKSNPELIAAQMDEYVALMERRPVTHEKVQSVMDRTVGVLYTILRSKEDVLLAGHVLAPYTAGVIPRLHAMEAAQPWMRKTVNHAANGLRLGDKERDAVLKTVKLETVLEPWRHDLRTPDRTAPKWIEEIEVVFRVVIYGCCRTPQECQMMFPVFGDMLAWRSELLCARIKREAEDREKAFRAAIKADVPGFVGMLESYRALVSTFTLKEDDRDEVQEDQRQRRLASVAEDSLEDWLKFARAAQKKHLHPDVQKFLMRLIVDVIRSGVDHQADVGEEVAEFVAWNKQESLGPLLSAILALAKGEVDVDVESLSYGSLMASVLSNMVEFSRDEPKFVLPHLDTVGEILDAALEGELYFDQNGSDCPSYFGHIVVHFINLLATEVTEPRMITVLYPRLVKAVEVGEDFEHFHDMWSTMVMCLNTDGEAKVALCQFIPSIVEKAEKAVAKRDMNYLTAGNLLCSLCSTVPLSVEPHMSHVIRLLTRCVGKAELSPMVMMLLRGLDEMAKKSKKVMSKELVKSLLDCMEDQTTAHFACSLLKQAVTQTPNLLRPHIETLRDFAVKLASVAPVIFDVFEHLAEAAPAEVERVMAALESTVKPLLRSPHPATAVGALAVMRRIGLNHPDSLARRKAAIESWRGEPSLHDTALHLLDVIANRTLAGVDAAVVVQGEKVSEIDTRLQDTEDRVSLVDYEVKQQDSRLVNVEERQEETEQRVDAVEENVGTIEKEVEELDNKTMTNAPRWSRQVALLLNVESDKDWRLLAQRLGFSPADIRGWATQHDPCMAVLSDWFATNRTAGATHAVRTALREMERLDALALVEEAVEDAEGVVADGPEEYASPPPIFLSYQWGHQPEAKLLRRHLELAGYSCWMDVGNMGGGDKLYEAIDRGLRGAAVMVACVTPKYAQSDNCRRELNLAANIGKPIIPLQMERMEWPPAGPMGPLLAEYLFIRLFSKAGPSGAADQPFWPAERFQELLMQVRLHVAPDHASVREPYERWWDPPEEVIVVPSRPAAAAPAAEAAKPEDAAVQPDVFISYQWGRQAQVKRLFNKLSGLGVACWMDIFQMGGGDSLYDKIDRGVRACKAVIACVTPKYALSPNCRKEVSLSHALKKPIIPLMLEQTDWPPAGPMSMVFTELLYIGVHKSPGEQETWEGPRTDELLGKLRELGVLSQPIQKAVSTPRPASGKTAPAPRPVSGKTATAPIPRPVSGKTAAAPSPRPGTGKTAPAPRPVSGKTAAAPTPVSGKTAPAPRPVSGKTAAAPSPRPGTGKTAPAPRPGTGKTAPAPRPVSGKTAAAPTPVSEKTAPAPRPVSGKTAPAPTPVSEKTAPAPRPVSGKTAAAPTPASEKKAPIADKTNGKPIDSHPSKKTESSGATKSGDTSTATSAPPPPTPSQTGPQWPSAKEATHPDFDGTASKACTVL